MATTPPPTTIAARPRAWIACAATLAALIAATFAFGGTAEASSGGVGPATNNNTTQSDGTTAQRAALVRRYGRIWRRISRRDRRWARRTAKCESGLDPNAIGGGGRYRGAFQFLRSTWRRAPRSPGGDPIDYPYRVQAVVAIALKKRDGAGHWPVCG